MKYMLLIHLDDEATTHFVGAEIDRIMAAHGELQKELVASGELLDDGQLRPEISRVVRRSDGETLVTDGPFSESKEWIAGFYVVECASIERAAEIAGRMVEAEYGPIEVRPIG
jgi:hypothetical protein